ncbi:hypothetical protein FB466_2020 [Klugiella xanthotipulae]|uniref:ATP/GTP-binding protein n=1 Tax=Klugiella xanthotipulae TaxID=244735 RepID=A0A543HRX2_9MICO|nr:hypothetical protein [Klugiella xanthotipulae]TQM61091.1 hypothetical protein FB466_2020 [Klugiella xanthotipulae]
MPRSNRPKRSPRSLTDDERPELSFLLRGWRRTEERAGLSWAVQPIAASRSVKEYRCPGCERMIAVGVAHVVVWRAHGVLGDDADLAGRRHWHEHCWKIR